MKTRVATSSYAHEIARKAWEDIRRAKRRPADGGSSSQHSTEGNGRLTAAEAASALRIRLEEKKRAKDLHNNAKDRGVTHPAFETTAIDDSHLEIKAKQISSSFQTHTDSWRLNSTTDVTVPAHTFISSDDSGDDHDASRKLSPQFFKDNSLTRKKNPRDFLSRSQNSDSVKHFLHVNKDEKYIPHDSDILPNGSERVRILADFTEGPSSRPGLNSIDRGGTSQLLKRCSPRHIEAQIYGVRQHPDTTVRSPLAGEEPIDLTLRISLNFSSIRDMRAFKGEVSENVARAAGIPAAKVLVRDVGMGRVGTVAIALQIAPDAVDHQGHAAADIAENLLTQAQDESSLLLQGRHTCRTISLAAAAPVARTDSAADHPAASPERGGDAIPPQIEGLLAQVVTGGSWTRGPQEEAAAALRDLLRDRGIAGRVARDRRALAAVAAPLAGGSERAVAHSCACLRRLALEEGCCDFVASAAGRGIMSGLVAALHDGSGSARQKAAAALGNLAWRSPECRAAVCAADGAVRGLLGLLVGGTAQARAAESALAALSNLTQDRACAAALCAAPDALTALCAALNSTAGGGREGSEKAEVRAAGILRNLAVDSRNRARLRAVPGLEAALRRIAAESPSGEARERAEAALRGLAAAPQSAPAPGATGAGATGAATGAVTAPAAPGAPGLEGAGRGLGAAEEAGLATRAASERASASAGTGVAWGGGGGPGLDPAAEDAAIELLHGLAAEHGWPAVRDAVFVPAPAAGGGRAAGPGGPWAAANGFLRRYLARTRERDADVVSLRRSGQVVARFADAAPATPRPLLTAAPAAARSGGGDAASGLPAASQAEAVEVTYPSLPPSPEPEDDRSAAAGSGSGGSCGGSSSNGRSFDGQPRAVYGGVSGAPWRPPSAAATPRAYGGSKPVSSPAAAAAAPTAASGSASAAADEEAAGRSDRPGEVAAARAVAKQTPATSPPQAPAASGGETASPLLVSLRAGGGTAGARGGEMAQNARPEGPSGDVCSRPSPRAGAAAEAMGAEAGVVGVVGAGVEAAGVAEAAGLLREWTGRHGWYELQRRLFDAGETDFRAYAAIEPRMRPAPGPAPGLYAWEGRTLRLVGQRRAPRRLVDAATGEVLWDFEASTRFRFPWARAHLVLAPPPPGGAGAGGGGGFQVRARETGSVVAEYAVGPGGADALRLQAILMEAAPAAQGRPELAALVAAGAGGSGGGDDGDLVQAVQAHEPASAAVAAGGGAGGGRAEGQLRVAAGDVLRVSRLGAHGWAFARIVAPAAAGRGPSSGGPAGEAGAEGWVPATFVAPLAELSAWRGQLLRITRASGGPDDGPAIRICDAATGGVVYSGPDRPSPAVVWRIDGQSQPQPVEAAGAVSACGGQGVTALRTEARTAGAARVPGQSPWGGSTARPSAGTAPAPRIAAPAASPAPQPAVVSTPAMVVAHCNAQPSGPRPAAAGVGPDRVPDKPAPRWGDVAAVPSAARPGPATTRKDMGQGQTPAVIGKPAAAGRADGPAEPALLSPDDLPPPPRRFAALTPPSPPSPPSPPPAQPSQLADPVSTNAGAHDAGGGDCGGSGGGSGGGGDGGAGEPAGADADQWDTNMAAFLAAEAGPRSGLLLEGRFRCVAAAGPGGAAAMEETLELHTSGEFEYVGGSAGGGGEEGAAALVALAGRYWARGGDSPGAGDGELLLLVEVAAIGLGDGDAGGSGQEVEGVCVRGLLARAGGRIVGVRWVSGHEAMGMGACGEPLEAEHVVCDD